MILYITRYCTYALRVPTPPLGSTVPPSALQLVEVVPERGEEHWKPVASYYVRDFDIAREHADEHEARAG